MRGGLGRNESGRWNCRPCSDRSASVRSLLCGSEWKWVQELEEKHRGMEYWRGMMRGCRHNASRWSKCGTHHFREKVNQMLHNTKKRWQTWDTMEQIRDSILTVWQWLYLEKRVSHRSDQHSWQIQKAATAAWLKSDTFIVVAKLYGNKQVFKIREKVKLLSVAVTSLQKKSASSLKCSKPWIFPPFPKVLCWNWK